MDIADRNWRDLVFNAVLIWNEYDDTHGYATEKINRVLSQKKSVEGVLTIWEMFDSNNQQKLIRKITTETFIMSKTARATDDFLGA